MREKFRQKLRTVQRLLTLLHSLRDEAHGVVIDAINADADASAARKRFSPLHRNEYQL